VSAILGEKILVKILPVSLAGVYYFNLKQNNNTPVFFGKGCPFGNFH
jgi:hypothetical protein